MDAATSDLGRGMWVRIRARNALATKRIYVAQIVSIGRPHQAPHPPDDAADVLQDDLLLHADADVLEHDGQRSRRLQRARQRQRCGIISVGQSECIGISYN